MTRTELIALVAATNTKLDAIHDTVKELKEHVAAQNGRIRKAEISNARLNLAVFGIGAPLLMVVVGAVVKLLVG
ncbi:MAG TPA: hypothetical protein VFV95_15625 [Vicinamibacterales bacterium]|nr:hypothetical protein [Vicinamibacterales bacterium]